MSRHSVYVCVFAYLFLGRTYGTKRLLTPEWINIPCTLAGDRFNLSHPHTTPSRRPRRLLDHHVEGGRCLFSSPFGLAIYFSSSRREQHNIREHVYLRLHEILSSDQVERDLRSYSSRLILKSMNVSRYIMTLFYRGCFVYFFLQASLKFYIRIINAFDLLLIHFK